MGRGASDENQTGLGLPRPGVSSPSEDPLHRHEAGEPANSKPKEQTMSDESKLKTYTVIGVYAEDDQRFAEAFEAVDPDGAEQQAHDYAEAEIVIAGVVAGNVVMADAATYIPG